MSHFDSIREWRAWRPMPRATEGAVLGGTTLFESLDRRSVRKLAREVELARFIPGDVLATPASPPDYFHVVLEGHAEVRDAAGKRRIGPGGHFGAAALLGRATQEAMVVAADEVQLLRIPRGMFLELASRNPRVALAVLRQLAEPDPRLVRRAA